MRGCLVDEDYEIKDVDRIGRTGRVLHIHEFGVDQPARIVAELREYWNGLRLGRAVPSRSDIEPRGIRRALDYAFIIERIAPGAARFRLAGRHLIDLMGMEVRGMPVCSFLNPGSRGRLSDVLETVFKAPQIAELHLTAPADYARPELKGHMIFLPLKSDLGDVTRALGCLIADGDMGVAPRRFDIVDAEVSAIFDGAKAMEPSPSARGLSEEARGWQTQPAKPETAKPVASPMSPKMTNSQISPEERRARFRVVSRDA